ncbi:MAG: metabolite traffic protein EboE, partial [Planctomycetaceae bacterium]|nr:metabolite traffic protein EboE [Planctomycetaceae bacterium]
MTWNPLPLSYCTNVHPGRTVAEVEYGLNEYTVPLRSNFGEPLAAGLWLAQPVVRELLETPDGVRRFAEGLDRRGLSCHTLNAFPFGDFHSARVKENVYLPDWTDPLRLQYTEDCAKVLAALLPPDTEGSISTVPLGFKEFEHAEDFEEQAIRLLLKLAVSLDRLHQETGRKVRLAIEPEPFCLVETTDEAIAFFQRLFEVAMDEFNPILAQEYLGLCYDVCHQAVEFEDVADSIGRIDQAGIAINKIHITCAIHLGTPSQNKEGLEALARYVEPRYLHQTMAKTQDGAILRQVDLTEPFARTPPTDFQEAAAWR